MPEQSAESAAPPVPRHREFGDVDQQHRDTCDGHFCPCYQEGLEVLAHSHWSMLTWIAQKSPQLLRDALEQTGGPPEENMENMPDQPLHAEPETPDGGNVIGYDGPSGAYCAGGPGAVKLGRGLLSWEVRALIIGYGKVRRRFWLWNKRKAQLCFDEFKDALLDEIDASPSGGKDAE